jgi:hypothetical protein
MAEIIEFADYYCEPDFNFTMPTKIARVPEKATILKPERQGSLDGLCGIYCVINAVNLYQSPKIT